MRSAAEPLCRKHPGSLILQRSSTAPVWNNLLTFSLQTTCAFCYPVNIDECRVSGTNLRTAGFLLFFLHSCI
ncbi:hypothetical protein CesoFtcFv8_027729 [Champsocephalus esox]|uniref:Uncharacterized protein n=1 Tax=Champsocephalus esox TaxID=159716 RepID=A0AAN7YFT0_9TELE|nr:hypothetical protein CesoFtcFv8_027729 [Champsocephalus esox]